MVVIRLSRGGSKARPFFNIVVADKRIRRDGRFIERIGFYNPIAKDDEESIRIAQDRLTYWTGVGAQASPTVERLVKQAAAARPPKPACLRDSRFSSLHAARPRTRRIAGGCHRSRAHPGCLGHQGLVQGPAPQRRPEALFSSKRWYLQPSEQRRQDLLRHGLAARREAKEHSDTVVASADDVDDRNARRGAAAARASSCRARAFPPPATTSTTGST